MKEQMQQPARKLNHQRKKSQMESPPAITSEAEKGPGAAEEGQHRSGG